MLRESKHLGKVQRKINSESNPDKRELNGYFKSNRTVTGNSRENVFTLYRRCNYNSGYAHRVVLMKRYRSALSGFIYSIPRLLNNFFEEC